MRDFNDADRKKKGSRIRTPDNPGNLPEESLRRLEAAVTASLKDGCMPCPSAWRIAAEAGVARLDVGAALDRLGIRVTECQLGCFMVSKTAYTGSLPEPVGEDVIRRVEALGRDEGLTCSGLFAIARDLRIKPGTVADAANVSGLKIRQCQLGCF